MSSNGVRPRVVCAGLVTGAVGWVVAGVPGHRLAGLALVAAGLVVAGIPLWAGLRRGTGSTAVIGRWDRPRRRHQGTASRWVILRSSSGWAMRRRAGVVRPSP